MSNTIFIFAHACRLNNSTGKKTRNPNITLHFLTDISTNPTDMTTQSFNTSEYEHSISYDSSDDYIINFEESIMNSAGIFPLNAFIQKDSEYVNVFDVQQATTLGDLKLSDVINHIYNQELVNKYQRTNIYLKICRALCNEQDGGYKQKYEKYKQKIFSILKGGAFDDEEWFSLRINPTGLPVGTIVEQHEELNRQMTETNKLGQGGQSSIYKHENPYFLIRTIEQTPLLEQEVGINVIVSNIVKHNENPHFCMSYFFINDKVNNALQIIEKMDGDVNNAIFTKEYVDRTYMNEQLLIGLYTLTKYKILSNDIKPQNVLYKKLTKMVMLVYKYNDYYFSIETDVVYAFTDFGKGTKYKTECGDGDIVEKFKKCAKNLSDINSISLINNNMHSANYAFLSIDNINNFLKIGEYTCGLNTTQPVYGLLATNEKRYVNCINSKLEDMIKNGRLTKHIEIPTRYDIPVLMFDLTHELS